MPRTHSEMEAVFCLLSFVSKVVSAVVPSPLTDSLTNSTEWPCFSCILSFSAALDGCSCTKEPRSPSEPEPNRLRGADSILIKFQMDSCLHLSTCLLMIS